jgi:hypothetical protein
MLCYALSPVANSRYAGLAAILALIATSSVTAASSTGRCNTIQCVDSTMLPREKRSVWLYSVKT